VSDSLTAELDRLRHGLDDAIDEIASLKRSRDMLLSDRSKLDLRVAQLGNAVDAGLEERDGLAQQVARLEHEARGVADEREAERLVRDQAHVMLGQISGIVQPGDGELLVPAVRRLADQEAAHHERLWNLARAVLGPVRDEGWWRPGPGHSVSCCLCENAADEQAGAGAIVHDVDCAVLMARAFLAGEAT
jgi:hypothetical protein